MTVILFLFSARFQFKKNRKDISYPTIIRSAIRPVPHGPDLPIPSPPDTLENILDDLDQISLISSDSDDGYDPGTNDPKLFSQSGLNDLIRDLGLPKDTAEVLGSRLKERNLLNSGVSFWWYRFREKEFISFFTQEGDLVFCNNVPAILEMFKIMYEPEEWRLFIEKEFESCTSSQCILGILGQQSGYTKFPCFLCEWDSLDRKQHYVKQTWPIRKALIPGVKNVERQSLVDPKKILFPPFHIKLGLMKQFVKALDKEGECFKYLCEQFPGLSDAKLKEGIFVGPDIRKLLSLKWK
ncbi:uncharacterized protein TNCV_3638411 [Trichonephila clavipes]|nr:uncharacterized protein TNCV_3638411 [Trichonephila clavipes]